MTYIYVAEPEGLFSEGRILSLGALSEKGGNGGAIADVGGCNFVTSHVVCKAAITAANTDSNPAQTRAPEISDAS